MAILLAEGFEDFTSFTGEYNLSNSGTISATNGRRGGACWQPANAISQVSKNLGANYSELYMSAAVLLSNSQIFFAFLNGATVQVQLQVNADGSISALRNTTVIGTSAVGVFAFNVYNHIQCRVVLDDTAGVVQVRINGSATPELNLTAVDTNNAAGNVANIVRLRNSATGTYRFDDWVVWDTTGSIANTWLGDTRVDSYRPNGNGDSSQFVGSDGNSTDNYLLVDGADPNTTDYVESDVVGDKDLYQFGNLAHTPSSIFGVVVTASALKDDAGTRDVRLLAKTGSTEVEGATTALLTSRTRITHLFEVDPTTSSAWTKSGIDGAQFGVKVQA